MSIKTVCDMVTAQKLANRDRAQLPYDKVLQRVFIAASPDVNLMKAVILKILKMTFPDILNILITCLY